MKKIIGCIVVFSACIAGCDMNNDRADAYGNFEVVEVLVSAENQGKLLQFDAEEGDRLGAGQIAGIIDTIQLSLKADQLKAGLQSVQANIRTIEAQVYSSQVQRLNLKRELDRVNNLFRDGAATSKQIDDLKGQIDLVDSQIATFETQKRAVLTEQESIRAQMKQIRDQIRRAIIVNPIDGILLQKYRQAGELVVPGQNLYKIANTDEMILRAFISGKQLSEIRIGEEVQVIIDSSEGLQKMQGRITWISQESEFTPKIIQTRDERINLVYAIKIRVINDGRIKIGMPGEVLFNK